MLESCGKQGIFISLRGDRYWSPPLLFAFSAPEGADAQVAEDCCQGYGDEEAGVLRSGCVTEAGSPQVLGEIDGEEAEEEAGDLEPENAADACEGTQETANAAASCAGEFVGLLADLTYVRGGSGRRGDSGRGMRRFYHSLRRIWRRTCIRRMGIHGLILRLCLGALLGDASGDAEPDSQSFAKLVWIHLRFPPIRT
jgi:hypothetical protein